METLSKFYKKIASGCNNEIYKTIHNHHKGALVVTKTILFVILSIITGQGVAQSYTIPVGIPEPVWGALHPIDTSAPDTATKCSNWPNSENEKCYYIDTNDEKATDTANQYGYPGKPRVTIPEITYPAGSYVDVRNGPYTGGSQITMISQGTEAAPVWIRGGDPINKALIRGELIISGSYAFVENFNFDTDLKGVRVEDRSGATANHIVVRDCSISGTGNNVGNSAGISISGDTGFVSNNIVAYNNTIHHLGDSESSSENDYHGIKPSQYVSNVWIINNIIYNNGGDGVQVGNASLTGISRPEYIYIGGNIIHDDGENAIDIKSSTNIIISSNTLHSYEDKISSSDGTIIVVHNGPEYVWIINNKIYDGVRGIRCNDEGGTNIWVIGNLFYDIHHSYTQQDWDYDDNYARGGAIFWNAPTTGGIVNNTLYDYDIGIQIVSGTTGFDIYNNILSDRAEPLTDDILIVPDNVATASNLDNNLFYNSAGEIKIFWASSPSVNVANIIKTQNVCLDCLESNPLFIDPANHNFHIKPGSPLQGKGVRGAVYDIFENRYGPSSIAFDFDGTPRPPANTDWDLGAFQSNIPPLKNVSGSAK